MEKRLATVFGGSEFGPETQEYQEGVKLGSFLAQAGYTVKCGGYYGLMEAVAQGVTAIGGCCIGVTNAAFDPKPPCRFITMEQKAPDLFDRLRSLIEDSELFVVQRGSLGTLVELFLVWSLAYTRSIKPVKICLIGTCWYKTIAGLEDLAIKEEDLSLVKVYPTIESFFMSFED